jgi:hypothetical protein
VFTTTTIYANNHREAPLPSAWPHGVRTPHGGPGPGRAVAPPSGSARAVRLSSTTPSSELKTKARADSAGPWPVGLAAGLWTTSGRGRSNNFSRRPLRQPCNAHVTDSLRPHLPLQRGGRDSSLLRAVTAASTLPHTIRAGLRHRARPPTQAGRASPRYCSQKAAATTTRSTMEGGAHASKNQNSLVER